MVDTEYLQKLIARSGYKRKYLAHFLHMSDGTLRNKLLKKTDFSISEAQQLSFVLGMTREETARCFWPNEREAQHYDSQAP
ncbi:hypothetical protein B5G28_08580 [Faecalibacterium sp. An77]|uniref:hypothetical protein n=1 Tax=Faecalibacterium sp. An77 TaxID=1965655 RepID=UPI000B37054B|nr:hypothetical protein [Faecalibacterium sp. An77]OUN38639.1 hypothetical protein B5G28_08580 [Faecalibacterium sp. An77]